MLPEEISLTSAIYLLAFIGAGGPVTPEGQPFARGADDSDDDFDRRGLFSNLAPTAGFGEEVLERLGSRGLVAVGPDSGPDAFLFDEDMIVGVEQGAVMLTLLPDVLFR